MSVSAWLWRRAMRAIPRGWRDSVRRDLEEEAAGRGLSGRRAAWWQAVQALRIAIRFGSRRRPRSMRAPHRRKDRLFSGLSTDIRMAGRSLRREPRFWVTVSATLGLGIGGVTATFAVFNHVVFRPVPGVADEARLVTLYYQVGPNEPTRASASFDHLVSMREGSPTLEGLAAWSRQEVGLAVDAGSAPDVAAVTKVSRGYFELLGVRFAAGRSFSQPEYDVAGTPVLVVSERFARERLGSEPPSVIGRELILNGRRFEVIGVASRFRGLDRQGRDDLWVPYHAAVAGEVGPYPTVFAMVGRLRDGATLEQAQEQVSRAAPAAGEVNVGTEAFGPVLFAGLTDGVGLTRARLLRLYRVLMAGVVLLFLLACANTMNMVVARNIRRRHVLAVRSAIGAGRRRLARELAVESISLAALAAGIGLAVALTLTGMFRGTRLLSYLPTVDEFALDWRVAGFCITVAIVSPLLFGTAPALMASSTSFHDVLRGTGRSTSGVSRLRAALVGMQLALSLVLLVGAGLLVRTSRSLQDLELGMNPDGVLSFALRPVRLGYDDARIAVLLDDVRDRLQAVPGFDAVALSWAGPFGSYQMLNVGGPTGSDVEESPEITHYVSPQYFDALQIPVRAGRVFTQDDAEQSQGVTRAVLVNESFARKWFGSVTVVGSSFSTTTREGEVTLTIVGVVGDARYREIRAGFAPMIYHPARGHLRVATVLIRTALPPARAVSLARSVVHEADPLLPLSDVGTVRDQAAVPLVEERLLAKLGTVIAAIATFLAIAGLYAVMTYFVNERVPEFAIRMALGADEPRIIRSVLSRVLPVAAGGLAFGVVLVLATSRLLASRLFGVSTLDPLTITAASLLLAGAAITVAFLPARRATRIDPLLSLRRD